MGTKLINQANSNKALENIGKTKNVESLKKALNNLIDELAPNDYDVDRLNNVIAKGKTLISLIRSNHYSVKSSNNFDQEAIEQDLMDAQDIVFRIESIKTISTEQLKAMNELYRSHTKLQKLIKDKI